MVKFLDIYKSFLYNQLKLSFDASSSNGRTADSGSVCGGSSPPLAGKFLAPSSSGSGRRPLTSVTGIRIPLGLVEYPPLRVF